MPQLKVLAINGSYRDDGITDQVVTAAIDALDAAGADTEVVNLRNYPIGFCLNCRECTQQPGTAPGKCVLDDGMSALIEKIEAADAFVFASPTNFKSVTALFKRFMERLVAYAYWPWDKPYPQFRKHGNITKKALLVTSSAAPSILGRIAFASGRQLKMTAETIGAKPVGLVYAGLAGQTRDQRLADSVRARAQKLALKLAA